MTCASEQRRRDGEAAGPKIAEKSHFHGKAETDPATGRSWMAPPKDLKKADNEYCYLPKKWIHTWAGHSKGVNAIRSVTLLASILLFCIIGRMHCALPYQIAIEGVPP